MATNQFETVVYETRGRIATIALDRPEKLNALSLKLQQEIVAALQLAERDREVRVIILKGNGRAFCAGYDLSAGLSSDAKGAAGGVSAATDAVNLRETLRRLLTIWDLTKPVIAQVHGFCLAGGTQLALICDLTVAAEDVTFGIPQLPVGIGFVLPFWTWLIGPKKAREVFYRIGSKMTAAEALRLGMINAVFPPDRLEAEVLAMAESMAETPSEILQLAKRGINQTQEIQGFRESLNFGCEIDALSHQSDAVKTVNALIKEHGLGKALQMWRNVV